MELQNFIDGEFVACSSHIESYNPATGTVHLRIPDSGEEEVELAVQAALRAFKTWSKTSPKQRSAILLKIADLIEEKLDEFAEAESRDQGKPVWLAKKIDIPRAVHNFKFFATGILHSIETSVVLHEAQATNYTCRSPVGVAGLISPWNLPIYLLTFKVAPALAAGCTVVCKPSEMTSLTAHMMAKVMKEAGLPAGVCNIVYGTGPRAGEAIVKHPSVSVISFTGSTAVGRRIQSLSAPYVKKLSLELGGKNAGIVFNDADLNKCVSTMLRSSFINQGEVCLTTSRIFVQEGIYQSFLEKFVKKTKEVKVGDPNNPNNMLGALVSKEHMAKVKGYIELARSEGCTVLCGDGVDELNLPEPNKNGYFLRPTVISDVSDESRLMKEEVFGPVTCVVPFKTEEEVIHRANDVEYGLCACVWSENSGVTHRVAQAMDVGTVWVNCWLVRDLNVPFGGAKMSGVGREGLKDSLEFYSEVKTVCIKY
jgi:acyl-CoA reductase-like NAD-dependent aldehyde dehydrogenase